MRNALTDEQKAKLPKCAQAYIDELEGCLRESNGLVQKMADNQTPTQFYVEDLVNVDGTNRGVRRYIDGYQLTAEANGVKVNIFPLMDGEAIRLNFENTRVNESVVILPRASNSIHLQAFKRG